MIVAELERALLARYPGQGLSIHLKPYRVVPPGTEPDAGYRPLIGDDSVPWHEVLRLCGTVAGTQWFVVEYERERARRLPDAPPVVDVRSGALLRWNNGTEVPLDQESYHAAVLRAIALDGVEPSEDGRLPRSADARGRRDMWRRRGGGKCSCGQTAAWVGGNRAVGLISGCRACVADWVEHGFRPARQR